MRTFVDNAGRTWSIYVNVDSIKRVRHLLHVDLLEIGDGKLLERLSSDAILLCDVLYCLVRPEADAQGVSDTDFGKALAGDSIERATTVFLEELVDFFPTARRQLLAKALAKLKNTEARLIDLASKKLDSPEMDSVIEQALQSLSASSGSLPASSASIPDL